MKSGEVIILLRKYFEGETTLEEERLLREFFRQELVPEELQPYRKWFTGLGIMDDNSLAADEGQLLTTVNGNSVAAGKDRFFTAAGLAAMIEERDHGKRIRMRSIRYAVTGIAASLMVTLGTLFWYQQQPDYRDTFDNPQQALSVAGETLAFVSAKYNKGLEQLAVMQKLTEAVRPAREPLSVLNRGFEKADLFGPREEP